MRNLLLAALVGVPVWGIAVAAPTIEGLVLRIHNLALASFPAAGAGNTGGILYDSTNNEMLYSNGSAWGPFGQSQAQTDARYVIGNGISATTRQRIYGWWYLRGSSALAAVNIGAVTSVNPALVSGTGTPNSSTLTYTAVTYLTGSTINNTGGVYASGGMTKFSRSATYHRIRTTADISSMRLWLAYAEVLPTLVVCNTSSTANTNDLIGVCYDSSVGANWLCCSGNGTNYSCTDIGLAVATDTDYSITVDNSVAGTLTCTVNGTSVARTTLIPPADDINANIYNSITTLAAANKSFSVYDWGFSFE